MGGYRSYKKIVGLGVAENWCKKGRKKGVTLRPSEDMGDLQTFLLHAQIFPNIWAKAYCLLYVMFNILGLSSHPRFCRLFNWPRKIAEDSRNTSRKFMCQGQHNSQNKHVCRNVCPFWDTFIFGTCLVYGSVSKPWYPSEPQNSW